MKKIDLKKEFRHCYTAKKDPVMVKVQPFNYISIDGKGDPNNSPEFQAAVSALFTASYTLKFIVKKGPMKIDYGVMPLEGQWWAKNHEDFIKGDKAKWFWTVSIMQPEFITEKLFEEALATAAEKKKGLPFDKLRFEKTQDGLSAQLLHTGPFSEEGPNIERMHQFIKGQGYKISGKHREIYLNNFLKVKPEKMKTILKQPVK